MIVRMLILGATMALVTASGCSRSAAPGGGGGNNQPSSNAGCATDSDCSNGEICNFFLSSSRGGQCNQPCTIGQVCSSSAEVCSPITGLCEPKCSTNADCQAVYYSGSNPVCVSNGTINYCANPVSGNSNCSTSSNTVAKASGGVCKHSCSSDPDCWASGTTQRCDAITGTCEIPCSTTINCKSGTYTSSTNTTVNLSLACSPITATCVASCTGAGGTSCPTTDSRQTCYVPGNTAGGSGTCEMGCAGSATQNTNTCSSPFGCSETICQTACTSLSGTCNAWNNEAMGRTTCDMIDNVCRAGCNPEAQISGCVPNLECSKVTATCVAPCSNESSCPTSGNRKTCTSTTASPGTCEIICTTQGSNCTESGLICQRGPSTLYSMYLCQIACTSPAQCPSTLTCLEGVICQ